MKNFDSNSSRLNSWYVLAISKHIQMMNLKIFEHQNWSACSVHPSTIIWNRSRLVCNGRFCGTCMFHSYTYGWRTDCECNNVWGTHVRIFLLTLYQLLESDWKIVENISNKRVNESKSDKKRCSAHMICVLSFRHAHIPPNQNK